MYHGQEELVPASSRSLQTASRVAAQWYVLSEIGPEADETASF